MSGSIQSTNIINIISQLSSFTTSNYTNTSTLNDLSSISDSSSISSLSSVLGCSDSSDSSSASSAFNIMLTSLLSAISEKNKQAKTEEEKLSLDDILSTYNNLVINSENTNTNNYIVDNITNLTVDERIENAIQLYSNEYDVDSNLVKAIIKAESNFDPNAQSSAGAKVLMQIMPENYESLGISDPFNIEENIEGGVKLIKEYLDRYDCNVEMALMAYNGGPTRMMNRGVNSIDDIYKMPKETQNYVPKVMDYYRGFSNGN